MLDLAAIDALVVRGVEAVALGEEVRERARARTAGRAGGTVAQAQLGGRFVVCPPAGIGNAGRTGMYRHACTVVGQVKDTAGTPHRQRIGRV